MDEIKKRVFGRLERRINERLGSTIVKCPRCGGDGILKKSYGIHAAAECWYCDGLGFISSKKIKKTIDTD